MDSLKWVLLHAHIWYAICDLLYSKLVVPYMFFPIGGGIPAGLLSEWNINGLIQMYCAATGLVGIIGPFIVCVMPILYVVSSIMTSYYNQVLNNMVYVLISHHGFLNTILMVVLFAPYREYTKSLICIKKEKCATVSIHIETKHALKLT
ncbi:unnamed protein product [Caenorhabditis bovis]|uniref:Uncharacterized protein n=1 Tax=Caenorhabditis bovis TaxID=2654633 RepID=A0A8S1E9C8_9PELO|nr:unnamed protein product [Caenorhabditis bovis]